MLNVYPYPRIRVPAFVYSTGVYQRSFSGLPIFPSFPFPFSHLFGGVAAAPSYGGVLNSPLSLPAVPLRDAPADLSFRGACNAGFMPRNFSEKLRHLDS